MALLDFREIASAHRAFNTKQGLPVGVSSSVDDFELFAQEFFTSVKKMKIFKSVSNGPDLGIDLGVIDASGARWLVSCKHYAHSDKPIPVDDEGVVEKVFHWECEGFIGFYTSVPCSRLDMQLSGAEKHGVKVQRYTKDKIESELLNSSLGTQIAARYFPKSMTNHYHHIIQTVEEYSPTDVLISGGVASLNGSLVVLSSTEPTYVQNVKEKLARDANILATIRHHRPYFAAAIKDAIELAPSHFVADSGVADHFHGHSPTWDIFTLSRERSVEKIYFVGAAWAFWDWYKANIIFAKAMAIRSDYRFKDDRYQHCHDQLLSEEDFIDAYEGKRKSSLLNIGLLSERFSETHRNVIGRLFLFGQLGHK